MIDLTSVWPPRIGAALGLLGMTVCLLVGHPVLACIMAFCTGAASLIAFAEAP